MSIFLLVIAISLMISNDEKEDYDPTEEKWSFFNWLMHGKKGNEGID